MATLPPEIVAYYERGEEDQRLRSGAGRLEYGRTQDLLRRLVPISSRVLDVGGGSGVHAEWLAEEGHHVELIDPLPLHVAQAERIAGVTARLGDALELPCGDDSFDVVLLMGPLYHLIDRADRVRALREAARVSRGLVVCATINRCTPLHDTLRAGRYFDPAVRARVQASVASGTHRPREAEALFTTAYFHTPEEIATEAAEAALEVVGQYGVEGAAWLMGQLDSWLDDPAQRAEVLDAMRLTESVPSLLGVSAHLLTAMRR
jgi:2-polyprenyl-3-methyl-5-hydroxy-6-metoxy-1,4-benzoquinol methylase